MLLAHGMLASHLLIEEAREFLPSIEANSAPFSGEHPLCALVTRLWISLEQSGYWPRGSGHSEIAVVC